MISLQVCSIVGMIAAIQDLTILSTSGVKDGVVRWMVSVLPLLASLLVETRLTSSFF